MVLAMTCAEPVQRGSEPVVLCSRRASSLAACRTSSSMSSVALMHLMIVHQLARSIRITVSQWGIVRVRKPLAKRARLRKNSSQKAARSLQDAADQILRGQARTRGFTRAPEEEGPGVARGVPKMAASEGGNLPSAPKPKGQADDPARPKFAFSKRQCAERSANKERALYREQAVVITFAAIMDSGVRSC